MIFGTRLSQLGEGDILSTNTLSYQGLDGQVYTGVAASEQKLQDMFTKMSEIGIQWVIDSLSPTFDAHGNLSFTSILNDTIYGNNWNFMTRAQTYEKLASAYNIEIVVQVNFPERFTVQNHEQYVSFVNTAVQYLPWVKYWQIGYHPEMIGASGLTMADPIQYVSVIRDIYNSVKIKYPGIQIMGPGVGKALFDLATQTEQLSYEASVQNFIQADYQHDWLRYAIDAGLLYYCDIFTITAYDDNSGVTIQDFSDIIGTLNNLILEKSGGTIPIFVIDEGASSYNVGETQQAFNDTTQLLNSYYYGLPQNNPNNMSASSIPPFLVFKKNFVDRSPLEAQFNAVLQPKDMYYGMMSLTVTNGLEILTEKTDFLNLRFLMENLNEYNYSQSIAQLNNLNIPIYMYSFTNEFSNQIISILLSNVSVTYPINPSTPVKVLSLNGSTETVSTSTSLTINNEPTLLVTSIVSEVFQSFLDRQQFIDDAMNALIEMLPAQYNKEITDVNYYKLLRAAALEIGTAKTAINTLKNNIYIDTAAGNAIDMNFGALISLPRDISWDDSTYRFLVKSITQALLTGPTLENMVQTIHMFTGYNAVIHELYDRNDPFVEEFIPNNMYLTPSGTMPLPPNGVIPTDAVNPRFGFVVEIMKDLSQYVNQDTLMNELNYVIGIIKPAHTLNYIVVALSANEDYETYFNTTHNVNWNESDILNAFAQNSNIQDGLYGWRAKNYPGQFTIGKSRIGGPVPLGPRYTLYDLSRINFDNEQKEYHVLSSNIPTAFTLNISELTNSPFFYPDQVIQNVDAGISYTGEFLSPEETHSSSFDGIYEASFVGDAIVPIFKFNVSDLNITPLAIQQPAQASMYVYPEFRPKDSYIVAPDPSQWFRLNESSLNNFIFSQGSIDSAMFMGPDYDETKFETPLTVEIISTHLSDVAEQDVKEESIVDINLPEVESHVDHFFNQERFFYTNQSPLNQSLTIDRFNEIEYGPVLDFTHDEFQKPTEHEVISTGYAESLKNKNVFYSNSSYASSFTYTNGAWSFPAIVGNEIFQEAVDFGPIVAEIDIVNTNKYPAMILNQLILDQSGMYAGDYDRTSMSADNIFNEIIEEPLELYINDMTLFELDYTVIAGTSFTTNVPPTPSDLNTDTSLTPIGSAVLGNKQRMKDITTSMGAVVSENIDIPQTVGEITRSESTSQLSASMTMPSERGEFDVNMIGSELAYTFEVNTLFTSNASMTVGQDQILYALRLTDSFKHVQGLAFKEQIYIRPETMFTLSSSILSNSTLNNSSFSPSLNEPDMMTDAVLWTPDPNKLGDMDPSSGIVLKNYVA